MKYPVIFVFAMALAAASPSDEVKLEGRILKGQLARRGQLPYQVGLSRILKDKSLCWCGGSLLNNKFVLTAAHCVYTVIEVVVYLGATNRLSPDTTYKVSPRDFIIHRFYKPMTLENDIALIRIPFTHYTPNIQPVELPKSAKNMYIEKTAIVSGWGPSDPCKPKFEHDLYWGYLSIVTNKACHDYLGANIIKTSHICAFSPQGISASIGDSGGPLVLENSKLQIGIVSMGARGEYDKCYPNIFTRITKYLPWIKKNTKS